MIKSIAYGVPLKRFFKDLNKEMSEDNVSNGAASLAYYFTLAIFPGMLALLSVIPYLPIQNVDKAIMDLLKQALPDQTSSMFSGVVEEITKNKKGGLFSFGLLAAIWAASNGIYAIMQQLNITYDVTEGRPFWKSRLIALGLTALTGLLMLVGFSLVVLGGQIQGWLGSALGAGGALLFAFAAVRWAIIVGALLLGFAVLFYWGPDVEQKFRFVTPGSVLGVLLLVGTTLGFKAYVSNFGKYEATYGSIGAVIVLMLWLYFTGLTMLLGSEVNALLEHYSSEGKSKGQKRLRVA